MIYVVLVYAVLSYLKLADKKLETNNMERKNYTVDFISEGSASGELTLALSSKKISEDTIPQDRINWLRLEDDIDSMSLKSRYSATKENPLHSLEHHLNRLSRSGDLGTSEITFGCFSDPFHPFANKFDVSIKALELFARYMPGHITVQTRSPLLVIALPVLKRLGNRVTVSIAVETNDEQSVLKYTPGLPRIEERLKMATAFRRFGVETAIQVAPILPYGDWKNDAEGFAATLVKHADFITVSSFHELEASNNLSARSLKNHGTVARLADERKFHCLRKDAAEPLRAAIMKLDAKKLDLPERLALKDRQLSIFAA